MYIVHALKHIYNYVYIFIYTYTCIIQSINIEHTHISLYMYNYILHYPGGFSITFCVKRNQQV